MRSLFLCFGVTLLSLWVCNCLPRAFYKSKASFGSRIRDARQTDVELISNGSTYFFISIHDGSAITVLPTGDVIADIFTESPYQKWTLYEHAYQKWSLRFDQAEVPYNTLSGFEPIPGEPEIYPRAIELNKHRIMPDSLKTQGLNQDDPLPWQILLGKGIVCLENMGLGNQLEAYDCEINPAPWQYWEIIEDIPYSKV